MRLKRFKAENFRNISYCDIEFSPGVNLLFGKNAQGKTNAVEGIYMFSRGRSFRLSDDKELIKFDTDGFRISIDYEGIEGQGSLEYACFGREKRRLKNGYKISRAAEMLGSFRSVLFYPDNLELVKDGPEERRSFLNVAISQYKPSYLNGYTRFKEALENRNSLLKLASKGFYIDEGELIAWSESLAEYSSYIFEERREYIRRLKRHVLEVGLNLSQGKEEIELLYKSDVDVEVCGKEKIKEEYERVFKSSLDRERAAGTTLFGPHRDDLIININGKSARSFASQGQQRSTVLALKLGEGEVLNEIYGEHPVFLFDDVLSELDSSRREFVISGMKDRQVIITSCEGDELNSAASRVIEVDGGNYVSSYR